MEERNTLHDLENIINKLDDGFDPILTNIENALAIHEILREIYFEQSLSDVNTMEIFVRANRLSKVLGKYLTDGLSALEKELGDLGKEMVSLEKVLNAMAAPEVE